MNSRFTEYSFLSLAAKKASTYVLEQNWFADPLEVRSFFASFDSSIKEIISDLLYLDDLNYQIQKVTVPKSIAIENSKQIHKCRDLSHLPFKAQVLGTAILMALSDEWESILGDSDQYKMAILGNRLDRIEDKKSGKKVFRVGSKTVYRFWADDYSQFVSQTSNGFNRAMEGLEGKRRVCLISTDISSFYPSINLDNLIALLLRSTSVNELEKEHIKKFFSSIKLAMNSAEMHGLPQGMVASGFFANIYLTEFDQKIEQELLSSITLKAKNPKVSFYSRYVDDIRIVVTYDPTKSAPIKRVKSHPIYKAAEACLKSRSLTLSEEKTYILDLDRNGAKLTEGLLAEHMQQLSSKAYGALIPHKAEELSYNFELLFGIDSAADRKPAGGEVQRNKYKPVIDGPGVRPESRKRFAVGKFRRLYLTYKDCSEKLDLIKNRFIDEVFREWKNNPSQIRLLYYVFDLSGYQEKYISESIKFVELYPDLDENIDAKKWIPFIRSSILRTFIDRATKANTCSPSVLKLVEKCLSPKNPWYLRALAWQLLAVYRLGIKPTLHDKTRPTSSEKSVYLAYSFWRFCMAPTKSSGEIVRNGILVAKTVAVSKKAFEEILRIIFKNTDDDELIFKILSENIKEILKLEKFEIRSRKTRAFAQKLSLSVEGKKANKTLKTSTQEDEWSLASEILKDKYRDPLHAVELFTKVVRSLMVLMPDINLAALRGRISPFSFKINPKGQVKYKPRSSLAGWSSLDWESANWLDSTEKGSNWGWPLGLLLRLILTGKKELLFGTPPSYRYNQFINQSKLCAEGGFAPDSLVDILSRLTCWPGTHIQPYKKIFDLLTDLDSTQTELNMLSISNSIRLLNGPKFSKTFESTKLRVFLCQTFNGLPRNQMLSDTLRSRKMVLHTLDEVESRISVNRDIKTACGLAECTDLIIFPEMSVPKEAIGDLFRFVKKNNVVILFGAFPEKDNHGVLRNTLHWMFPTTDRVGNIDVQYLKQDKIFPIEAEISKLGIVPANPQIIWRLNFAPENRLCAINCYELTNIDIKALLSGRVEFVSVCASNTDVSLFDGQAKSYSYDLYGFVCIVNSGLKGGSCIYAPYKGENEKQIIHLHGEEQLLVPAVVIDTSDFRSKKGKPVKTEPAGFKIRK